MPSGASGLCPGRKSKIENPKSKIQRGSVLVIVMITLIFTSFALVAFIDKASNDLLVESRVVEGKRLRAEAYSALETTLAVLEDFRQFGNGLHSPSEGWNDPLAFAEWVPTEGRTVTVSFEDESGKLSLPRVDTPTLTRLFQEWELSQDDAERLADALMGWMKAEHIYSTTVSPDYERAQIPYLPPARSLRSYRELAVIEVAREMFFTEDGQPNALWHRFTQNISLYDFRRPNLNGAKPDVLAALGQFEEAQRLKITEYLAGGGPFAASGQSWFTDTGTVRTIAGEAGNPGSFGTTISALRVFITVQEGLSQFRLSAVVAPPQNGATTVQKTATDARAQASAAAAQAAGGQPQPSGAAAASANPNAASNAKKLNYPFTLLEIRENDEIPPPPPPPPAQP
ncbi:MAG TPA: hypothetical protein VHO24_13335 [Opitutaceae bacterium]|nr:hypothetical protein [Opitutaceae bacterium]